MECIASMLGSTAHCDALDLQYILWVNAYAYSSQNNYRHHRYPDCTPVTTHMAMVGKAIAADQDRHWCICAADSRSCIRYKFLVERILTLLDTRKFKAPYPSLGRELLGTIISPQTQAGLQTNTTNTVKQGTCRSNINHSQSLHPQTNKMYIQSASFRASTSRARKRREPHAT